MDIIEENTREVYKETATDSMSSSACGKLDERLIDNMIAEGIEVLTPFQNKVTNRMMNKSNILIEGRAGTGKTTAVCIGLIQLILSNRDLKVLCLYPRREITYSVQLMVERLARGTGIESILMVGGADQSNNR